MMSWFVCRDKLGTCLRDGRREVGLTPCVCIVAPQAQLEQELFRVQQSSAKHKLSRRNCVELVAKLIEKGKLDVRDGDGAAESAVGAESGLFPVYARSTSRSTRST